MNDSISVLDDKGDATLEHKVSAITALFDSFDRKDLAGGYAAAVVKGQRAIFKKGYGVANHEYDVPFTSQTMFDLASVAKQFTGYCVADLVRRKRLALEDDVRNYLPELPDYGPVIEIRHLLGHTSGLRDWFPLVQLAGRGEDDTITDEFLMKLICRQRALNFVPGSQHAYSNTGYFLLAQVIKRVTGKSLRAYAQEKIFAPLGMDATFFADKDKEIIKNRAAPYMRDAEGVYGQGGSKLTAYGSSSLFSNLDDMIKWAQHLDARVSGGDETFNLMLTPTVLNDGTSVNYNFGIAQGHWREHACIGHGGSWNAYACEVVYFPAERLTIMFITNRSPNYVNTHDEVRRILFDAAEVKEGETEKKSNENSFTPADEAEAKELSGEYYSAEIQSVYAVRFERGRLIAGHLVNEDVTLSRVGPGIFRGDKSWFEEIVFTRDADCKIDGFLLSVSSGNMMKNLRFVVTTQLARPIVKSRPGLTKTT